jgi:pimeloyl-ACP methyl ester carboxylesterase
MKIPHALLSGLLAIAASTAHAQASSAKTERIAVDGHHISFHVTAGKRPAIVLDAGGGLDSTYWTTLVPELAKRTGREIITYDRSGFGASEEVPGPWNLQKATDDLEAGLKTLGATKDVILVSHSIAGEIALTLANRHPTWLAGAVSVDANVPEFFTDKTIETMGAQWAPLVEKAKADPSAKESRQLIAVADSFRETNHAFHRATWPARIPVVVIVSEKTPFEAPVDAQWWRDAHARFAQAAPNRRLVVAQRSSHDVAHDRPDLIIQAVVDLAAGKH